MTRPTRFPNELLREQRLRRGWSLDHMADQLRRLACRLGESEPGVDGNMISRWERGLHRPGPRYVRLLRLLYDEAPEELGLPSAVENPVAGQASETFELAMHATASDLDQAAIDTLVRAVDRLSREYSTISPWTLVPRVHRRLWQIDRLLGGRMTLDQHRQLLDAAGWLHILLSVLHYDIADREAAEASREAALRFGQESDDAEIQGWAFEAPAYFALFDGRARDAVDLCVAGQQVAPAASSVFVALNMQEARGWARLGDRRSAEQALLRGGAALERRPEPAQPDHHFEFDTDKFAYYASTTYAWLGMAKSAEKYALQVMESSNDPRRPNFWPGRVRGAHLDLGLALAKQGRPDEAAHEGLEALKGYPPRTWLLRRAADLNQALTEYADVREVQEFDEQYLLARHVGAPKTDW
jgi:transcriptional regulator with XRE-family HTH domain